MPDKRVFNASPLIVLGKANQLTLLVELCETIVIPAGVAAEIEHGSPDDFARKWIGAQGSAWIKDVGQLRLPPEERFLEIRGEGYSLENQQKYA
jgi:hypothetical protein